MQIKSNVKHTIIEGNRKDEFRNKYRDKEHCGEQQNLTEQQKIL